MTLTIYTPDQLYRIMFDRRTQVSTSQWLDRFFPLTHRSEHREIRFAEIDSSRKIAPFMLPNEPGRPIYEKRGVELRTFTPAYTKPKDALQPASSQTMTAQEAAGVIELQTPEQRHNAEVLRILRYQRATIERLWDYMAAKAIIDGQIVVDYQRDSGLPAQSVVVDFGRDPAHTITLAAGARWGDPGVNIFDDIQSWTDTVAQARFGGSVRDIILGAQAAQPFMESTDIEKKLDTNIRGAEDVNIRRSLLIEDPMDPFTYLGTLGAGTRVWRYTGTFESADGTLVNVMDPRDAVLVAPGVQGVRAYGAILDQGAMLRPRTIFSKMWNEEDPPATNIMSQSAPLMIPSQPNCTLRARVVA